MDNNQTVHVVIDSLASTSDWMDVSSALLTPTIALFGLYIAYRQHKNDSQRLKHELYDRRVIIFKHIKTYLSEIFRSGKVTYDTALKFNYDVAEATFLVDENINSRIKEIYEKSIEMASLQEQMYPANGERGLPVGAERSRVAQENKELLIWLTDQLKELKPLFEKHLGLS